MMIIDCHAHLYSGDLVRYPTLPDPLRPPPGTGTVEHLREESRAAGGPEHDRRFHALNENHRLKRRAVRLVSLDEFTNALMNCDETSRLEQVGGVFDRAVLERRHFGPELFDDGEAGAAKGGINRQDSTRVRWSGHGCHPRNREGLPT